LPLYGGGKKKVVEKVVALGGCPTDRELNPYIGRGKKKRKGNGLGHPFTVHNGGKRGDPEISPLSKGGKNRELEAWGGKDCCNRLVDRPSGRGVKSHLRTTKGGRGGK